MKTFAPPEKKGLCIAAMVVFAATAAQAEPRSCPQHRVQGMLLSASLNSRLHILAPADSVTPLEAAQDALAEGLQLQADAELSWSSDAAVTIQQADNNHAPPKKQTTSPDAPVALTLLQSFYQDLRVAGLMLQSTLNSAMHDSTPTVETSFASSTNKAGSETPPFPTPEQMGVAVSYMVVPGVSADLNYRLQNSAEAKRIYNDLANTGANVTAHELSAGVRFEF
ncbi:MAG: hypothetical protein HQM04_07385 [Magnetococcales bacterium]|nr:hypothetical protein [Magnetococcales bacterium]MBF0114853.1 hypothetical protein [Magnetococcales bacterium]